MNFSGAERLSRPPIPTLRRFYEDLIGGDTSALKALFAADPAIDTPLQGKVIGPAEFNRYVAEQREWLLAHQARSEVFNWTSTQERVVLEFVLYLDMDRQTVELPVALAADLQDGGVAAIRIYHSTWPLTGAHLVRPPLLPVPETELEEPAVVQTYMDGIRNAEKERVLALFSEDGYAREPSGARFKHAGPEGLGEFYSAALDEGGIVLHHCSATFDSRTCAIEFICDEWAHVRLPPQAGLAVYELAGPDKLRAVRIYDDITPPFE